MIDTVMILCAGFGTRLNELTRDIPKPMLPISGKPMLEHTIKHLANLGIKNLIINLHYLPDRITDYFGNGNKFNVNVNYSYEEKPLGTAGSVKKVENILSKSEDFFVLYGDLFTTENYKNLYNFHKTKTESIGTIVLHERNKSNSIVEMDENNKIIRFVERPENEIKDKKQNWVNSGLYCFNKKILDFIPENKYYDFPKNVFSELVLEGKLFGFPLTQYRCAVDSVERYKKLQFDYENKLIIF